jgi:hypothetical protein
MPINRRILSQDAAVSAAEADSAQGLVLHLDANDEDSIENGGANTGAGSGTWFDISTHDLNVPLVDKASNLQLHLNASDTTSYGGSGDDWTDISQNSNTASDTSPTFSSDTRGYFVMDGSNDYFTINYDASLYMTSNTGFTIEAWVNRDSNSEQYIIASDDGLTFPFALQWHSTTHGYSGWISGSGYSASTVAGLNNVTTNGIGEWDHLVLTQSSSDRKNRLYVNGTLTDTSSAASGFHSTSSGVNVGAYHNETGKFDGKMSVIRIYNAGLTASEVAQNFRSDCFLSYDSIYSTNLAMNLDAANYTSGTWSDSAGSNNGTVNGASFDKELGNFFDFDGSNDTITVSATASAPVDFSSETYSIGMWANIETLANDKVLIGKFTTGSNRAFQIQISSSNKLMVLERGSGNFSIESTQTFTANTWFYFLYTRAAGEAKIYVNGLIDNTASASETINDAGTTDITIGNQAGTSEFFTGKIGQVKIYSATLNPAQVAQNYLATKNNYPNTYHATIDGASFSATSPAYFDLDGSNDHIDTTFKNTGLEEFTISAYIRFVSLPSTNKYFINDTTNGHEYSASFLLGYLASNGNWIFYVGNGSSVAQGTTSVSSGMAANTWTHIVFTCDGINDTVKYYKNGSLSATVLDGTATNIGSFSNTGTMQLGRWAGVNNFHTDIDFGQFKIFNKTLSASEVLAEYNATKSTYGL